MHVFFDRFDVLHIFFGRIRIVKAQVGFTLILFSQTEIQANAFRVTDMQIPVRFRRKARMYPIIGIHIFRDIRIDLRFNKIAAGHFRRLRLRHNLLLPTNTPSAVLTFLYVSFILPHSLPICAVV